MSEAVQLENGTVQNNNFMISLKVPNIPLHSIQWFSLKINAHQKAEHYFFIRVFIQVINEDSEEDGEQYVLVSFSPESCNC